MELPQRKSPRRQDYDYTSAWAYFITICTAGRQHYFGEIKNEKMILNELGEYCEKYMQNLVSQRSTIEIHEFVIMPNHVHILLLMSEFKPSMNQEYIDYRQDRRDVDPGIWCRDDLLGHPDMNDIECLDTEIIHATECRDALLGRPDIKNMGRPNMGNKTENGHAKSMSLQPTYNPNYQWPTLWSIINMFKGAVTKYAKSWAQIPYWDTFARQSRYHDHIIRNEKEYQQIRYYIQTNPQNRENDMFNK